MCACVGACICSGSGGCGGGGGSGRLCTEDTGAVCLVSFQCTTFMNWMKIRLDEILLWSLGSSFNHIRTADIM
jgi:hypothetical protein